MKPVTKVSLLCSEASVPSLENGKCVIHVTERQCLCCVYFEMLCHSGSARKLVSNSIALPCVVAPMFTMSRFAFPVGRYFKGVFRLCRSQNENGNKPTKEIQTQIGLKQKESGCCK